MPAEFDACRAAGGKIRTLTGPSKKNGLKADEYVHVCILRGKVVRGEIKKKVTRK